MILRSLQIPLLRAVRNSTTVQSIFKKRQFLEFCGSWKEKFANALAQPDNVPKETWEEMRNFVKDSELKPTVVDIFILQMCVNEKYPEAGISYYKFLQTKDYKPSVPALSTYLQLYSLKDDPLTEEEKKHVLSLCKSILKEFTSLNSLLVNILVNCLCKIGEWEEAVRIVENFKENHVHIRDAFSSLISYFYANGKEDLGHEYLVASMKVRFGPSKDAYDSYLQYCLKDKSKFNERIEDLFKLWNKYGIKPSQKVILEMSLVCNQHGWSSEPTRISRSTCAVCKQELPKDDLTNQEYQRLRTATLKSLISNKMYYVTNPREIKNYMKFIDERKSYDVVIDGLNVLYANRAGISGLAKTVKYYKHWGKNILVVGRIHMKKMVDNSDIKDMADYFYVQNWSKDDMFVLYAAFCSGKDTVVISHDIMRQHKFAMNDPELDALFKKWQATHHFMSTTRSGSAIQSDDQVAVHAIAQKKNDCWHVPHVNWDVMSNRTRIGNDDWFCFKLP